jgi:hypothetical protein
VGKQVTVWLPLLSGTSNATSMSITGFPVGLVAVSAAIPPTRVTDNGAVFTGGVIINTSTTWDVLARIDGTPWTASGTKGINSQYFTYLLA